MAKRLTTQEFIEKARAVHGDKYGYDKVDYKNTHTKVIITCPDHGDFPQEPAGHLRGQGCPACGVEFSQLGDNLLNLIKSGRYIDGSLYVIQAFNDNEEFFKIGISTKTIGQRFGSQKQMPYDFEVLLEAPIGAIEAFQNEQRVIEKLIEYAYEPQIYFPGITECLSVNPIEHDPYLQAIADRFKD